jgi:hypothetical protein
MLNWTDEKLKSAGLSRKKVESIVRKLEKISKELTENGLWVYGESGTGYLTHESHPEHDKDGKADHSAIIARIGQGFDGGGW